MAGFSYSPSRCQHTYFIYRADGKQCLLEPSAAQNILIKFAKAQLTPEQLRRALEAMDHRALSATIVLQVGHTRTVGGARRSLLWVPAAMHDNLAACSRCGTF